MTPYISDVDRQIFEEACKIVPADESGQRSERALVDAIAGLLADSDLRRERERHAKKIIKKLSEPGATEPGYQLNIFGDVYWAEPFRVIRNNGYVSTSEQATWEMKRAEARRHMQKAEEAMAIAKRRMRESDIQERWARKQLKDGRPSLELTWGNCCIEMGLRGGPPSPAPETGLRR